MKQKQKVGEVIQFPKFIPEFVFRRNAMGTSFVRFLYLHIFQFKLYTYYKKLNYFSVTDFAANDVHKLTFTKICQELRVPSDTHKRFKRLVFLKRKFMKWIFDREGFFPKKWDFRLFWYVPTRRLKVKWFMSFNIFLWPSVFVLIKEKRLEQNFGNYVTSSVKSLIL